jgi:hypothetical protein
VTASAMAGNAIMTGLDLSMPTAAIDINTNKDYKLEEALNSIENELWKSIICRNIGEK